MPHNQDKTQENLNQLLDKARMLSLDLERHCRIESSQGQLSPTDMALFSRVILFLRHEIQEELLGTSGDEQAY